MIRLHLILLQKQLDRNESVNESAVFVPDFTQSKVTHFNNFQHMKSLFAQNPV